MANVAKGAKLFATYCCLFVTTAWAQTTKPLTIDSCFAMAKRNYPLVKQIALIEKTTDFTLDNISKGYWPQISINGQASYQSAVTEIPASLPDINVPSVSKDQYRIYGEVNQPLTDVRVINKQKELVRANSAIEEQKIDVALYKLKERISNLFFGILLINAQIRQIELLKKDIQNGIDKTKAAIANGVSLKINADLLTAELLKANQRTIELKSNRKGYSDMLSLFINQTLEENTKLVPPAVPTIDGTINRPELELYNVQKKNFDLQRELITVNKWPRLSLFIQGGYGKPALNMLNSDFETYYIGGLRLNWNLSRFYTSKKEKHILLLHQNMIEAQRETFLLNTHLSLKRQSTEVSKYQELLKSDNEIIALRENIKTTANNQLANGTITTGDYLIYLNAEDQARQNRALHQIQLLKAQYNYQTTAGN